MIVSEFIEWLKTQDQGATVWVMEQQEPGAYQSYGECTAVPFDPEKHAEYMDWREVASAKGHPFANDHDLTLGTNC